MPYSLYHAVKYRNYVLKGQATLEELYEKDSLQVSWTSDERIYNRIMIDEHRLSSCVELALAAECP